MAVSYISSASAAAATVTMPTHQAGDLIVAFAYRDGNTTAPTLPAGWTNIDNSGANTNSARLAYKYATSAAETTGTWTNATGIVIHVYRGTGGIGASAVGGASSNTITYPALTLQRTDNTSWAVRFAGHRTATNLTTNTPAGYTARTGVATEARGCDTNATISVNPTTGTQAVDATSGYRAYTLEILGPSPAIAGLVDDFNDNSLDATKWTPWAGGTITEASAKLQIQSTTASSYRGMDSTAKWSLTGSSASIEVPHVLTGLLSSTTYMRIQLDNSNAVSISTNGTSLIAQKQITSTYTQLGSVAYSTVAHRWWRIRESGGTVYFEFSADGLIWTSFATLATPFSLGALTAQLAIGTDVTNASTDTAIFDNFNIPPAFETFSDNFNDNVLDTSKWTDWSGTDVSETSKTLQIASTTAASYKGMNSAVTGNLTGSYVQVEVPHVLTGLTGASTLLQVAIDNQHTITLYVGGTTFAAEYQINGVYTTPATMAYSTTAHRWWRIRESGGTIYYEYSADSSSWSVLASAAAPFAVTNLRVSLFIGTTSANASTDTAIFDNLNAFPLLATANGQYRNDQSTPIAVAGITTDGVTNNVWLETMGYADDPTISTTISAETQIIGTNFTGTPTASKSLILKQANLPTSRRGSAMIYDAKNKRFIVFGGYDGTSRFNDVWELSADSAYHRWKKLTPSGTAPVARNLCGSVYARGTTSGSVDKAYMVIWGGADPGDRNDMAILDVSTPGSEAWSAVTQTNAPSARDYITHHMAAKVTASNTIDIYLFGGWASSRVSDLNRCTLNVNSPTSVTWTQLKASGAAGNPAIRSGATMVYDSANDRLIITGGFNNTTYLSDVWQYSISGGSFTQLSPTGTTPAGRELASIGYDSVNQRAVIIGGWQGSAGNSRNDVLSLSLVAGSEAWTQIKSNDTNNQGVLPFSNACAAVDTNRNILAITNLYGYDATDKYVYAFNLGDTSTTASVYSLAVADYFRARDAPAFVHNTTRDELLLINGYSAMDDDATIANGEHVSEIWAYSQTNQTWRNAAKGPFLMTQSEGGLAVYDSANDRVIFFGGLRGSSQMSNDVWQLKADAYGMYKATKLSPSGSLPPQRWLMAGCYDAANHRMVIWGGQNASTILNDTWALDLTSGSEAWTQLTPTGTAPTAVWQSAYVYDSVNKRLYTHGGYTGASYSTQLFYLDLSTTNGAWVNTSVTGGLAVRGAVMRYDSTNQRLICFGGYDGTSVNNTVRYTSTASFTSWTTQATTNTPAARRSAGTGMINNSFVVTCGRPVSGTWFNDMQELDVSLTPASWAWKTRTPKIYQPVALGLTGLAQDNFHWRSWLAAGAAISPASSFGSNSETSIDFVIGTDHSGQVRVYNGTSWVWKPIKTWTGSAWTTKTLRHWNGSIWVPYTAVGASPVAIDAIGPSTTGAVINGNTTLSWSHTCSGTNRYLVVGIAVGGGQTTWNTTATCNGVAMTSLGRQQSDNQNDGYVELFGIIPPAGACAIVVTCNNSGIPLIGGSISATGVDQTTPTRNITPAYGDGTSIQTTVTGASNDLFIDAACCGSDIGTSLKTLQIQKNYNTSTGGGNFSMSTAPGATSATMGYTSVSDWWGIIGISLRALGT